jgi:hypothetical protein
VPIRRVGSAITPQHSDRKDGIRARDLCVMICPEGMQGSRHQKGQRRGNVELETGERQHHKRLNDNTTRKEEDFVSVNRGTRPTNRRENPV